MDRGRLVILLASSLPAPALLREHVFHVVGPRSEEQMVRPNASMDVASMKDLHPFRDRADVEFIRVSVGRHDPMVALADAEMAVAAFPAGPRPQPAPIGLCHALPKAFCRCRPWRSDRTKDAATHFLMPVAAAKAVVFHSPPAVGERADGTTARDQGSQRDAPPLLRIVPSAETICPDWLPARNKRANIHWQQIYRTERCHATGGIRSAPGGGW